MSPNVGGGVGDVWRVCVEGVCGGWCRGMWRWCVGCSVGGVWDVVSGMCVGGVWGVWAVACIGCVWGVWDVRDVRVCRGYVECVWGCCGMCV